MDEPKYKPEYEKMGVTPEELYLRQTGKCYLRIEKDEEGEVEVYCTDGIDKARTKLMLNPTLECSKCMTSNLVKLVKHGLKTE